MRSLTKVIKLVDPLENSKNEELFKQKAAYKHESSYFIGISEIPTQFSLR